MACTMRYHCEEYSWYYIQYTAVHVGSLTVAPRNSITIITNVMPENTELLELEQFCYYYLYY